MRQLLFLLLASSFCLFGDFKPSAWQYRKRLPITAGQPVTAVHIDREIYAQSQATLADLRIVHGTEEVPYLVSRLSGSREEKQIPVEILDSGATPGGAVQFTVALPKTNRHNRLTIQTSEINFKRKVKLEAGDTAKGPWTVIRKEAYIFDFTYESQHSAIRAIDYPASTKPFLRVTVDGWTDPRLLTEATISFSEDRAPVRQVMQEFSKLAPSEDEKSKSTVYVLDFETAGIPKDQLRLEVAPEAAPLFHRAVEVETSDNPAKGWTPHARGVIFRTSDEQSFWIQMEPTRARHLRVRVYHNDDKPLALTQIVAEAILRRVIFPVSGTGSGDYWLYYGNPGARAPSYDLPMVLAKSSVESASTVNAAAQEANAGYEAPPPPAIPFSDRHPELLYVTLGIAVLAIGFLTVRFLQKANTNNNG